MEWFNGVNERVASAEYLGTDLLKWAIILCLTAVVWAVLKFVKTRFSRRITAMASRTSAHWDDILARCLQKTHGAFLLMASLYLSAQFAGADLRTLSLLYKFFVVGMFFQTALWGNEILAYGLGRYLTRHYGSGSAEKEKQDALSTYSVINVTAKFILWTVLFLLLLDNLGVNITALVTGLGIGGIAIALAVQNILGDIFASLTIVMDRPFEVGDFIVVDDRSGTVEAIGLKTSRVRALSGEQLIFPNKKLVETDIQNFKRMEQRRIDFTFKVDYQTSAEVIREIPQRVAEIVKKHPQVKFDRSHLSKLGDSALEFQTIYIILSSDYTLYMDIQQQINMDIFQLITELKADFWYPTKVVIDNADAKESDKEGAKLGENIVSSAGARAVIHSKERRDDGVPH